MAVSKPILIYVGSSTCSACKMFTQEWKEIKTSLKGKVRFVSFIMGPGETLHPSLVRYANWLPTIILAEPKSYFNVFTEKDEIRDDVPDDYVISAEPYNRVWTGKEYAFGGAPQTKDTIVPWVDRVTDAVLKM